jgi:hypothetical protein
MAKMAMERVVVGSLLSNVLLVSSLEKLDQCGAVCLSPASAGDCVTGGRGGGEACRCQIFVSLFFPLALGPGLGN